MSSLHLAVTWLKYCVSAGMARPLLSFDSDPHRAIVNPDLSLCSPVRRAQLKNNVHKFSVVRPFIQCLSNLPDVRPHPLLMLTPAAVLEMPLNDVWYPSPQLCSITPKPYKRLLVRHCYSYNHDTLRLVPRLLRDDPLNIHPRLSSRLHHALLVSEAFLHSFCLSLLMPPQIPLSRPLGSITYTLFVMELAP